MTKLGDVATFEMGQAPPGEMCNKQGEGTLFVKAGEFGDLFPVKHEWTVKPLKFGKRGDVFICVVGATAGKLNLGVDCAIGRSVRLSGQRKYGHKVSLLSAAATGFNVAGTVCGISTGRHYEAATV